MNHIRLVTVAVSVVLALVGAAGLACAQDISPPTQGVDVVVVLDDSGSMATCWPWAGQVRSDNCLENQNPPSDPLNLRYSAVRLLVQLAADEDRLALVRFSSDTEDLIGPLQPVGNRTKRQPLLEAIKPPTNIEQMGGYTRIDLGLERATSILAASGQRGRPSYVLLLTDGVPTQPGDVPKQDQSVKQSVARLQELGAQVFPVILCNEKAGCPDDSFIRRTIGQVPEEAKTPDDLLRVFSAIFAQMKPDLHVVEQRNASGHLELTVRAAHGAQQLVVVAETSGLVAIKRDGMPQTVSAAYQDDNILVNLIGAEKLADGTWTFETRGPHSFVVAQTRTYPTLVHPPPSLPGSAAAPHLVPVGKPIAIIARVVGPGSSEPLRLDGTSELPALTADGSLRWTVLPSGTSSFTLQVGDDQQPLQIRRQFRLEARPDLPMALALSPAPGSPCLPGEPCTLQAGFGPGAEISELQGVVYVNDESDGGRLVYSAPMVCTGRECSDPAQNFKRLDGHTYTIRFILQARSGGVLFGDWAETTLAIEPAVYLRGLPAQLNLKAQPPGGWPVTVTVGTTEELGQLRASIALTRTNDNSPVADAQVSFDVNISGPGEQGATLLVRVPPDLRPGRYEGQITFSVDRPSAARQVRLPQPVPISFTLARPAAAVRSTAVDFGALTFDTSPNFRVDQMAWLEVQFQDAVFNIVPVMESSSCPGLELIAGPPQAQGKTYQVPLTLRSTGPIRPQTCSGTFSLHGPSEDYDVQPASGFSWRLVIPEVEWEVLGVEGQAAGVSDTLLGSLGKPGERVNAVLLVRYTGRPPFSFELVDLQGRADQGEGAIGPADVELVTGAITPHPDLPDVYRVPITLVARTPLAQASQVARWLLGTDYTGKLQLAIVGLPGSRSQVISFQLHNPGWYQRYIQPFYRWWWPGALTCTLSVLVPLFLFVLVWIRRKDAAVQRLMEEKRRQQKEAEEEPGPGPAPRTMPVRQGVEPAPVVTRDQAPATADELRYRIPRRVSEPAPAEERAVPAAALPPVPPRTGPRPVRHSPSSSTRRAPSVTRPSRLRRLRD